MIDLYTWTTPNGRKVSIMLEETALPYRVVPVNLRDGAQHDDAFRALNPNARIPVIVDHDAPGGPLTIFESGAILIYLSEQTGKFLPTELRRRTAVIQWLMFQMGGIGPMMGQASHFASQAPEKIPYAIKRYIDESVRLIGVMNVRLADHEYLGGDYSIADMATYPWVAAGWPVFKNMMPDEIGKYAGVQRWLDAVAARPTVQRGMQVPQA